MSVWDREIAALDFETTGLSANGGDRVIEAAVARGRFGEAPRTWSTLIHPGRPVGATQVHGITEAMLVGAPPFGDAAPALFAALEGSVVVAHNARFDLGFLTMECGRASLPVPDVPILDTLGMARRVLPLPGFSLAAVTDFLAVPRARAHRAADDALATWHVAWALLDRADPERALDLEGAQALCRRRTGPEQRALMSALQRAAVRDAPVLIEYLGAMGAQVPTRRQITIRKVTSTRVEAFCHLRGEDRVFRLDRIRLIDPT